MTILPFMVGCSGESGPKPVFVFPLPTTLDITGGIDLSTVAVHPQLGGVFPSLRGGVLLEHSHFQIVVEDDPNGKGTVTQIGNFVVEPLSIRDQVVIRFVSGKFPGFILEWMAADTRGLFGPVHVQVTLQSTARACVARTLRNRYGRRVFPDTITDAQIEPTVTAMLDVLEKNPQKIGPATSLDLVPEVVAAYTAAAQELHTADAGEFPNEWLLLVYQGGDNNLNLALQQDLAEMQAVGPPAGVRLLVQVDDPAHGIRRLLLEKGKETVVAAVGPGDSADVRLLADFLGWSQRTFPARRVALIVASHGSGWRAASGRAALGLSMPRSSLAGGVLTDDGARTTLGLSGLQAGLLAAQTLPGPYLRRLDLLGLDACLMGTLETAWQLRDTTTTLVFSQANEPGPGWPYDRLLETWQKRETAIAGAALAEIILQSYQQDYLHKGLSERYAGTLAVVDMAAMPSFMDLFCAWVEVLLRYQDETLPSFAGLRDARIEDPETFSGPEIYRVQAFDLIDSRDLYELVAAARDAVPVTAIAGADLLAAFPQLIAQTVHFGNRYQRAHGISISVPGSGDAAAYLAGGPMGLYAQLDLARDSRWYEWLVQLVGQPAASGPVHGRSLTALLEWRGQNDLDLFIGEPSATAGVASQATIWFSPVRGAASPNGRFTPDSRVTGLREEEWHANEWVRPGSYWIAVRAARDVHGASLPTASFRLQITTLTAEQTVTGVLQPGQETVVAVVRVADSTVETEIVPQPGTDLESD